MDRIECSANGVAPLCAKFLFDIILVTKTFLYGVLFGSETVPVAFVFLCVDKALSSKFLFAIQDIQYCRFGIGKFVHLFPQGLTTLMNLEETGDA